MSYRTLHTRLATLALALLLPCALPAQQLTPPARETTAAPTAPSTIPVPVVTSTTTATTSGTAPASDEVVQMSVFSVNAEKDEGYQALNTASGSRINTALKDTPAAISVFTQQFLQDVGASTIEDMLSYAANAEVDTGDSGDIDGNNDSVRNAGSQDTRFRIRGMAMSVVIDNADTGNPMDLYNVDRAEISSGPNSILFGMGSPGGIVALSSKRANTQRNTMRFQNVVGTWFNPGKPWNYYRTTLDYNLVLMPKIMALRLNGIYQEGGNDSWRKWMGRHDRRVNPTLTIKPASTTTLNFSFETGRLKEAISDSWNASDGITGWLNWRQNDPASNGVLSAFNPPPEQRPPTYLDPVFGFITNPISQRNTNDNRFTLFSNNGIMYNMRSTYYSNSILPVTSRLPEEMSSYYYGTMGPGGIRDQKFNRYQVSVEQRIGNFNLQLTYDRNRNNSASYYTSSYDAALRGDPNGWISSYYWAGPTGAIENPYAGQLYIEDRWMQRILNVANDALRLTAETTINLGKWGRHRLVANIEHDTNDRFNNALSETLLDERQMAITVPLTPADDRNYIFRRNYVTPGDFSTYHAGLWQDPIPDIIMNGHTYHSAWVGSRTSISHIKRNTDTAGLTLQSYFLKDHLILTLGGRFDDITFKRAQKSQISDPSDPRILNRTKAYNEWDFNGDWDTPKQFQPYTITAGSVWHATRRHSFFANFSTNRGAPSLDGRTVLPDGMDPPPSQGRTFDYGMMYDLLGTGKIFLRLTKFDTKMVHDASNGGGDNALNPSLGATNLYNIYDALYFLYVTGKTSNSFEWPKIPISGVGTLITGPDQGPMPASEYAVRAPVRGVTPYGTPPLYNAGMFDSRSRGYEAELTANITRNFTSRITFSWTQQERLHIFDEIFQYYKDNIPHWLALANQYNPNSADGRYWMNVKNYLLPLGGPDGYIYQQLYAEGSNQAIAGAQNLNDGNSVRRNLARKLLDVGGAMGARPIKININSKYTFQDGLLKGFSIIGEMQYRSRNLMPDPNRVLAALAYLPAGDGSDGIALDPRMFTDASQMIKGNSQVSWNGTLAYRRKVFGGRTTMNLQLNVKNLFGQNLVTVSRRTQYDTISRVYLNPPRVIRLTATFDF